MTVAQAMMERMDRIESLLLSINAKIDNFLGFEELGEGEGEEVDELLAEAERGGCVGVREAFGD